MEISNDDGTADSFAALTVRLPSEPKESKEEKKPSGGKPEIVQGLVPTTVKQGETATFTVKVKGPVKSVKWLKNGREIPSPKAKDLGDGTYQLEIPNCQPEDATDYTACLFSIFIKISPRLSVLQHILVKRRNN